MMFPPFVTALDNFTREMSTRISGHVRAHFHLPPLAKTYFCDGLLSNIIFELRLLTFLISDKLKRGSVGEFEQAFSTRPLREADMTLHQLKVFEVVVRHHNITQTSAELHANQPAISQQLKLLEQEYGKKFLLRTSHGMELTREGRAFLDAIKPVLMEIERIEKRFKVRQDIAKAARISVGGSASIAVSLIPALLAAFSKTHPETRFVLETNDSQIMEQRILESELDIAVITNPSYCPLIAYEPYKLHKLVAFAPPTCSLVGRIVKLKELAKSALILRAGSSILTELLKRGLSPNLAVECETPEAVKAAVHNGMGVGILPEESVQHDFVTGEAKKLRVPELEQLKVYSHIIYDGRKTLAPVVQDFLKLLRETKQAVSEASKTITEGKLPRAIGVYSERFRKLHYRQFN